MMSETVAMIWGSDLDSIVSRLVAKSDVGYTGRVDFFGCSLIFCCFLLMTGKWTIQGDE